MNFLPFASRSASSLLLVIATFHATAAGAQGVSPAYADININNTNVYTPGVFNSAGAVGTTQYLPYSAASFQTSYSNGSSTVSYFFVVNGPANTFVPVDIQFNAATSTTGPDVVGGIAYNFGAEAQLLVASQSNIPAFTLLPRSTNAGTYNNVFSGIPSNEVQLDVFTCITIGTCGDSTGLPMGTGMSGVLQVMLPTNLQSNIVLTTYASTIHLAGDFSSASVDPYVYVDPSVANPSLYSVTVSDGVGNTAAPVPEPGAWMTTLAGLVTMIGMFRRRSSRALPARAAHPSVGRSK